MGGSIEKLNPTSPIIGTSDQAARVVPLGDWKGQHQQNHPPQEDTVELHEEETVPTEQPQTTAHRDEGEAGHLDIAV